MLRCFADYNRESGRVCALAVTDDYSTPMFFLQYEARPAPTADLGSVRGAIDRRPTTIERSSRRLVLMERSSRSTRGRLTAMPDGRDRGA